jgi:putative transposase
MGRKGHGQQQIATILRKSDAGMPVADLCREHGISARTFYRWKAGKNGGDPADARVLKQIEEENQRLKSLVAELILENRALTDQLARSRKHPGTR